MINANLYNDYVVSTLIKEYVEDNPHGFLIYFSDHGEEVYDTPPYNIQGRNETAPTANMYTVPYIQLVSPSWQRTYPHDYSSCVNRKYSLSHFIHTWSEMAGLYYEGWCPEKSLINRAFTENIRWIGDPYKIIDYLILIISLTLAQIQYSAKSEIFVVPDTSDKFSRSHII
ncbi:hypothetical protein GE856_24945 [Salmonella enterica]|nr:hypothetical protein [Salmonella enterica]